MAGKSGRKVKRGKAQRFRLRFQRKPENGHSRFITIVVKYAPVISARMRPFTQPLYACLKRKKFKEKKLRWFVFVYVVLVSKANPRIALWLLIKSHRAMVAFWKFWVSITHAHNLRQFMSRAIRN